MRITPAAAISDHCLFGDHFAGSSWRMWRAVLKAAFVEPLDLFERALFRTVAQRDPPTHPVRELWVLAGRRAGKDSIASAIAATVALGDHRRHLRPGERASILCLAVNREQAQIVHRYIRGYFRSNALLAPLVERETELGLELNNGVEIIVATNSFRAVRGKTILCAILDETAFWRDETSANPDEEVYTALLPGLTTIPGSLLIGISTVYRRAGLLHRMWREHFGRDDDNVLVVKGTSRAFNPTLPQHVIDEAIRRDPEAASAEYLSEWRSDLADFVDRTIVEAAVVPGRRELPPVPGRHYHTFTDPSGSGADSFTLAIAHAEGQRLVLDAMREIRPPFSPEVAIAEFAALARAYRCFEVMGDRWGGEFPREAFRNHGIRYVVADRTKSDIYVDFLPLLNSGRVELLDHPRCVAQLCALERRTSRSGRDSIDHPQAPGHHDDVINSAAGALTRAAAAGAVSIGALVTPEVLARARQPLAAAARGPAAPGIYGAALQRARASRPGQSGAANQWPQGLGHTGSISLSDLHDQRRK